MPHLFFNLLLLATMLAACDKDVPELPKNTEAYYLKNMVIAVAKELAVLGFPVDCSKITIEVRDVAAMAAMFNDISDEARQEVRNYTPFGPPSTLTTLNIAQAPSTKDEADSRLAFYDPNSRSIVFRKGSIRELTKGYLVHELAHAYQDQKWGFDQIWAPYQNHPSRELFNITQFMIEGHAELVRHAYEINMARTHVDAKEISLSLGEMSENDCLPCHSKQSFATLPYTFGMRFLVNQYRDGGWPKVESLLTNLPESTEQIIHEDKFEEDNPKKLSLPSWEFEHVVQEPLLNGSLGEAFLLAKLLTLPISPELAFQSASGWDGDVAQAYRLPDDREAIVWRIVFDRVEDAQQFMETAKSFGKENDVFSLGRRIDWIITKYPDIKKSLRIFLSQNPLQVEGEWSDEQSTIDQEISISNDAKLYESPSFVPKIFIGPKA
jgi:hypothetical protein